MYEVWAVFVGGEFFAPLFGDGDGGVGFEVDAYHGGFAVAFYFSCLDGDDALADIKAFVADVCYGGFDSYAFVKIY